MSGIPLCYPIKTVILEALVRKSSCQDSDVAHEVVSLRLMDYSFDDINDMPFYHSEQIEEW